MAAILTASQVPIPVGPTSTYYVDTGTPPNADPLAAGDSTDLLTKFNKIAVRSDLGAVYGGGCFGVCNGLTLTGVGLILGVAAGQAMIYGAVELPSGASKTLNDSIARNFIWLGRDGAIYVVENAITPPSGVSAVFIGTCVTSAGAISSIDYSGVIKFKGGIPWRETADTAVPGDTPGSGVSFFTKTTNGVFFWDTAAYSEQVLDSTLLLRDRTDPSAPSAAVALYSKSGDLYFRDGTAVKQLTDAGKLYIDQPSVVNQLTDSVNTQTLSGNLTLVATDPNVQALNPNGSNRDVTLYAPTSYGQWNRILNTGTSGNLVVKSNGGSTIATLTSGQYLTVTPKPSGGSIAWPSAVTPES